MWCKARTTPFDLSQGLSRAIDDAAQRLGMDTPELLLAGAEILRYSTTLAMNKLIERKGPKLGLIMTEGFEDTVLVGRASQWSDGIPFKEQRNIAGADKPRPVIPKELTVGVKERVDCARPASCARWTRTTSWPSSTRWSTPACAGSSCRCCGRS